MNEVTDRAATVRRAVPVRREIGDTADVRAAAAIAGPDAEQHLIAAARRGDSSAFDALVRRHERLVARHIRVIAGARASDTDDLAQEVFVRAYRFLHTFREESSFRSWLFRVAANVTRSYHARRTKQQAVWADSGEGTHASRLEDLSDGHDLECWYLQRELIAKALATLPSELRQSVVLRDLHGLEYQEIAATMGVPLGTVESRIFRARQRLRPVLADLLGGKKRQ
jgi:RNA polymerase sigma-70 factor (ECF subfamily)